MGGVKHAREGQHIDGCGVGGGGGGGGGRSCSTTIASSRPRKISTVTTATGGVACVCVCVGGWVGGWGCRPLLRLPMRLGPLRVVCSGGFAMRVLYCYVV
jgi:hypothetical protein